MWQPSLQTWQIAVPVLGLPCVWQVPSRYKAWPWLCILCLLTLGDVALQSLAVPCVLPAVGDRD